MKNFSLAQKAQEHYEDVKVRFARETAESISATMVYGPNNLERRRSITLDGGLIHLVDEDSVSCLFNQEIEGKVAILNYASYKTPGGLYLQGSHAQEECLCHESNLYPILLAFDDSYYAWNRKNLNRALYRNRSLYTPNVVFEHNGKTKVADVITCAAPNFYTAGYRCGVSEADNNVVFKDRIRFMLTVAELNGVDTLISGAWGCGVFAQNPYTTCRMMTDVFTEGRFNAIGCMYYAIPGGNSKGNYIAFEEELSK